MNSALYGGEYEIYYFTVVTHGSLYVYRVRKSVGCPYILLSALQDRIIIYKNITLWTYQLFAIYCYWLQVNRLRVVDCSTTVYCVTSVCVCALFGKICSLNCTRYGRRIFHCHLLVVKTKRNFCRPSWHFLVDICSDRNCRVTYDFVFCVSTGKQHQSVTLLILSKKTVIYPLLVSYLNGWIPAWIGSVGRHWRLYRRQRLTDRQCQRWIS